jgi:threonine synthase
MNTNPDPGSGRGSLLLHLECSSCGLVHDASLLQGLCRNCARPLLARYDLSRAAEALRGESGDPRSLLRTRSADMWRYRELLPAGNEPVSLGEGWTPLLRPRRLHTELGTQELYVKDESGNPTGSFKARGLSAAVTMARERGVTRIALPTAGNAGLAAAAYASACSMAAEIFCPSDTPAAFTRACRLLGARVHLVDGLITDCAKRVREGAEREGWFDLSTLKEPYRLEGKKTMGYELWEQLSTLPDVIFYPTGGGTGLVGMWKAFAEMQEMGWIGAQRPRMVSVQADGCAPIVRAFHAGEETARPWENASTVASGLRVPSAVGDKLILQAVRESGGTAVAVSDRDMLAGVFALGRDGLLAAPEGGAVVAALRTLLASGWVRPHESVVLFLTGTALSYLDVLSGPES